MLNKLIQLMVTHPRLALITILSILFLAMTIFIAIVKGVAILVLSLVIIALAILAMKSFKSLKDLY